MPSADSNERFYFDSVRGCVRSHVTRRERRRTTLEQPLPFLRRHTAVRDERSRNGRVEAVRLAMDRGTPHLVVDVEYDDPEPTAPYEVPASERREVRVGRIEQTESFETPRSVRGPTIPVGMPGPPERAAAAPSTEPFELARAKDRGDAPIVFRPADHLVPGEPLYGNVRQEEALTETRSWWSRLWGKLARRAPS